MGLPLVKRMHEVLTSRVEIMGLLFENTGDHFTSCHVVLILWKSMRWHQFQPNEYYTVFSP